MMARNQPMIHVEGIDFIRKQLVGFAPREAKNIMRRTMARLAADLRKDMRASAPVNTGTLRKAIVSKRLRGTPNSVAAGVYITTSKSAKHNAWYWHFVEFGTRMRAANPFIVPAFERLRAKWRSVVGDEFFAQLSKQLAKRAKSQRVAS